MMASFPAWPLRRDRPAGELVSPAELSAAAAQLLDGLVDGVMSETAYDTAIVSRLRAPGAADRPAFPATLTWLRRHQHPDGSWGGRIATAHDRIVSTLAATVRLADMDEDWARLAVHRGVAYLRAHADEWRDGRHETIAFELLVPKLVEDALERGLDLPYAAFAPLVALRAEKLGLLPRDAIYGRPTTLLHSLEFLGDALDARRIAGLRGANGAYGNSPSATAHALAHAPDEAADAYLARVMAVSLNGGVPNVYPFEIFERAWALYHLGLAGFDGARARAHLRYLAASLGPEGAGISREGLIPDADDTAMVLIVLARAGLPTNLDVLLPFERESCFACFPFERNTSISANARVLEALRHGDTRAGGRHAAAIAKLLAYLRERRLDGRYWQDKWHVSPYYATAQVVLAARDIADALVAPSGRWLVETQRPDGAWGVYRGTCEETAYAVQSLLLLRPANDPARDRAVARGAAYLAARFTDLDYEELWVGKGLYAPYAVVRSAVISALHLYHLARDVRRKDGPRG